MTNQLSLIGHEPTLFTIPTPAPKTRRTHPGRHLNSTSTKGIRAHWCHNCRAPILTGYDADVCAFIVHVDVTPITAIGEALALIEGRHSHEILTPLSGPHKIRRRTATAIKNRPAGTPKQIFGSWDVVLTHQCHNPTPAALIAPSTLTTQADEAANDECPF